MLRRLQLENVRVIKQAEIILGQGLTAITGETGAGKSVLIQAIRALVEGERLSDGAYVEGEWTTNPSWPEDLLELAKDSDELILGRKWSGGRSRIMVDGRTTNASIVKEAGEDIYMLAGQHSQRRLLRSDYQRHLLDTWDNISLKAMHQAWERLQQSEKHLSYLLTQQEKAVVLQEVYAQKVAQIESVNPDAEEYEQLQVWRRELRNRQEHTSAVETALAALAGEDYSAAWAMDNASRALSQTHPELASTLENISEQVQEIIDQLVNNDDNDIPMDLEAVEARLYEYNQLEIQIAPISTIHEEHSKLLAELSELENIETLVKEAQTEAKTARVEADKQASALHAKRTQAAKRLAKLVTGELLDLEMQNARFEINTQKQDLARDGHTRVEFLIDPNGQGAGSLRDIASGGELSRVALAIYLQTGSEAPTLIFDEIDAGIGGQTAYSIGQKLLTLSTKTQVLCITHLAQIAALADNHVTITKRAGHAEVHVLHSDNEKVDELCRMIGAEASDASARRLVAAMQDRNQKRSAGD